MAATRIGQSLALAVLLVVEESSNAREHAPIQFQCMVGRTVQNLDLPLKSITVLPNPARVSSNTVWGTYLQL